MPRKALDDKDLSRGSFFVEIAERLFPNTSRRHKGVQLGGFSESMIRKWESGHPIANKAISEMEKLGVSLAYLFRGEGEMFSQRQPKDISSPSRRLPMMKMREYPTRGLAAADDSGRSAGPDTDEIGYPVRLPESMAFIPIVGESMSPVLLGGQLAMIDMNREGFERDRGIVIVNILEDRSNPGMPEPVTGTFCKRCERGDGVLYFTSINNYPPFSAWEENCRIWPVIGVWFGDKGVTPLED